MNSSLIKAARSMRAALRRVRVARSDFTTTRARPADHRFAQAQAANPYEPDVILLAALTLGGLMDPAVAVIIATLEADRRRGDQRRIR